MIFFTVLFLGTLYTKLSHGILQPCKLANERFADAVGFAVPGLTDHIKNPSAPGGKESGRPHRTADRAQQSPQHRQSLHLTNFERVKLYVYFVDCG